MQSTVHCYQALFNGCCQRLSRHRLISNGFHGDCETFCCSSKSSTKTKLCMCLCLFVCLSLSLCPCLSLPMSVCFSVSVCLCLSVSVYLGLVSLISVYLSIYLDIYLFLKLFVSFLPASLLLYFSVSLQNLSLMESDVGLLYCMYCI